MGGKTKTFLIILGMIGVYFIALNAILSIKMADLDSGAVRGVSLDREQSGSPAPGSQGGLTGELAVGNVVTFGSYEQDADFSKSSTTAPRTQRYRQMRPNPRRRRHGRKAPSGRG